ncbi:hypothetical protein AG1IA_08896 [Rhizoctonia solani AG-1 IA]|uniref:Uncharacterized protein n=1 Tax=Thanatephorus cucumeris (strain AG1-IA) TaxID=983506 RepID=L8WGH9_THACA|nr:hypothetical protein AG1IA_08896 [Rhizoctonia solani AG-1 IA]
MLAIGEIVLTKLRLHVSHKTECAAQYHFLIMSPASARYLQTKISVHTFECDVGLSTIGPSDPSNRKLESQLVSCPEFLIHTCKECYPTPLLPRENHCTSYSLEWVVSELRSSQLIYTSDRRSELLRLALWQGFLTHAHSRHDCGPGDIVDFDIAPWFGANKCEIMPPGRETRGIEYKLIEYRRLCVAISLIACRTDKSKAYSTPSGLSEQCYGGTHAKRYTATPWKRNVDQAPDWLEEW